MGRSGSHGARWAPSFFASSDFIDLNLMKKSVLIMERHTEEGGVVVVVVGCGGGHATG